MKKIVSAPRLHQSSILQSTPALFNQTMSRTLITDQPVKLSEYLKNRQETNKSYIMQRIKSNPILVTHQDPTTKQTREKKEFILRNTDKLVSLLTKKKSNIDSKSLSELTRDEEVISRLLEILHQSDKTERENNPFQTSRKQFKNLVQEQTPFSKTNGFLQKMQMPKLNTSSYLNKTDSVASTIRSEVTEKPQKMSHLPPKGEGKGGENLSKLAQEINFSRTQSKASHKH